MSEHCQWGRRPIRAAAASEAPVSFPLTHIHILSHSPDEVRAVAAEGWLLEEARDELVVLHLVHILLAEGSLTGEAARTLRYLSVTVGVSHLNEEAAAVREERGVRRVKSERRWRQRGRTSRGACTSSSSSPPRWPPRCRSCCRCCVGLRPAHAQAAAAASSGGSPGRAPALLVSPMCCCLQLSSDCLSDCISHCLMSGLPHMCYETPITPSS